MQKEAKVRIKINKLLKQARWRLLDSTEGLANVKLEWENPFLMTL